MWNVDQNFLIWKNVLHLPILFFLFLLFFYFLICLFPDGGRPGFLDFYLFFKFCSYIYRLFLIFVFNFIIYFLLFFNILNNLYISTNFFELYIRQTKRMHPSFIYSYNYNWCFYLCVFSNTLLSYLSSVCSLICTCGVRYVQSLLYNGTLILDFPHRSQIYYATLLCGSIGGDFGFLFFEFFIILLLFVLWKIGLLKWIQKWTQVFVVAESGVTF